VGIRKVVAFGRRHVWPITAASAVAAISAICGIVYAVSLMINGPFIVGYFLAAACGDVLIYGIAVPVMLWLPRTRASARDRIRVE
jgi:hypothetical protein